LKGIRTGILVAILLLGLSTQGVFSKNNSFAVEYKFDFAEVDGQWVIEDTFLQEVPGEPLIPYYPAQILLPQDTEVKHIQVKHSKPILEKGIEIPWGQPPCTFSDTPVTVGRNEKIYNSNQWYPKDIYEIVSTESFRGFQILNINLYPLQYKPKSQTVKFYPKLYVYVQVDKGAKNELYRGLKCDKEAVRAMVDNPEVAETYEERGMPFSTEEYIIITSSSLKSTFQTLATWKAGYVNGAAVYDTTYIYNNYTGSDNQMKIRNFIIDKYNNNGTKYVLLGGDTGVVLYRGFYVYSGGYVDYDMAADMYYGHLDGNWNNDGDSRYGEPGEEDWYAEVAVGRAPVDNAVEAQAFVDKVIAYEQMEKPDVGARKRVCFHQSRVQPGNNPDSTCLAYNCDDWIPGDYYIDYLFEEHGTVTKAKWRDAWAAEPIVVVHIGHGNTTMYYINYEPPVSWYNSDVPSLTNTFFPWTTSVACLCGQFTVNDCLAEAYVKDDCGAIGAIYNDNYGWYSSLDACKYSGEFCEMEVRACWSDGYDKLGELRDRSRYYMASSASGNSTYRWCYYERNLIGDPETPCLTTRDDGEPPTVSIIYPEDGSEVYGTVNITVCTLGCIDTVEIYINDTNGDPLCEKPVEPLQCVQCSWDTATYPEDTVATIIAEGYCSGELEDDDQVTVTVNNHYVRITNPEEGDTVFETVIITTDTRNIDTVEFWDDENSNGVIDDGFDDMLCTITTPPGPPFQCIWNTCWEPNGNHTIMVRGYFEGQEVDQGSVTFQVNNPQEVVITDPVDGEEVWDTVRITVGTDCIDKVEFYIDGQDPEHRICTDHTGPPFECDWDTTYYEDGEHIIYVKGYWDGGFEDDDWITVIVNNHHIDIITPIDGSKPCIGQSVNITTSVTACIDTVKFYIIYIVNDEIQVVLFTDTEAPFEYSWNTSGYSVDWYTIRVHAYSSGELKGVDQVLVKLIIC